MIQTDSRVSLGIKDERVALGSHIAYFWEDEAAFAEGVGFLETGLRGDDHCVVFGHDDANEEVCRILRQNGFDTDALLADGRLTLLGGSSSGDAMLNDIGATFERALVRAPRIRLLGNIGWGRPNWPEEQDILAFEGKVTGAASAFPCVVVCMYDVRALPGRVVLHGAFETHPLTICGNVLRENPYCVPIEQFLARAP